MRQEPEVEPRPPRHEALGQVERHAVGIGAEQRREPDVAVGHERQGRQEVLAELAVGDPRNAVLVGLERQRVDHDRPRVAELDVVGRGVLERPAGGQRLELDVERQQRGVLELAERPLEGIRDELDLLGPDDRPGVGRRGVGEIRRFVADQAAGLDQAVGQATGEEGVPVVDRGRTDLAVQHPVAAVDEAAGVAIGTGIADRRRADRLGAVSLRRRGHPQAPGPRCVPGSGSRCGRSGLGRRSGSQ